MAGWGRGYGVAGQCVVLRVSDVEWRFLVSV